MNPRPAPPSLSKLKRIYRKHNTQKIKRWTKEENELYTRFILDHAELLKDPSVKRAKKIFILMSNFIKTKNPSQCRSHHQKFYRKDGSSENDSNSREERKLMGTPGKTNAYPENCRIKIEDLASGLQRERKKEGTPKKNETDNSNNEEIQNINKLTEKELDEFICSAKALFTIGTQMAKLRRNFEDFETKNLQIYKESCNFIVDFVKN